QNNPAREALGSPARFYFPRAAECFWRSGACARGVAIVFLDLYGVLVDSEVMNRGYNARIAAILQRRFGGDLDEWRRAQAESFEWYLARGAELDRRDGAEREGDAWVRAVTDLNA